MCVYKHVFLPSVFLTGLRCDYIQVIVSVTNTKLNIPDLQKKGQSSLDVELIADSKSGKGKIQDKREATDVSI